MDKETIKFAVLEYLIGKDWTYGGTICREVGAKTQHKEAVVERHGLRSDLVKGDDPKIESDWRPNPSGKGHKVLVYRLKDIHSTLAQMKEYKPEIMKQRLTDKLF